MQSSFRAVIVIAAICAASLTGAGTPGWAIEPDKSVVLPAPTIDMNPNVGQPTIVPALASTPIEKPAAETKSQIGEDQEAEDQQRFETLSAAIAAQSVPESIDSDLSCLAGAIYFESKGEPLNGQLAVAEVIINRTKSGRFPRSICSVVTQRGQFSFVRGGQMPAVSSRNAQYRTALAVAQVAMGQAWDSQAADALFFHARGVSPGWRMTRVASIGHHVFYR